MKQKKSKKKSKVNNLKQKLDLNGQFLPP